MNAKSVLEFPIAGGRHIITPHMIGDALANRWFNGKGSRNGSETKISREDLAALLEGAATIALQYCPGRGAR